ncbi:MAG TPA: xanthine dehydrogenase family protein molybdopterin-binding subunit [Burkholderiales bacterium]|nr:xanthine dehydrogenase family protein molybdopterin-binding subunit [Burkholderiales bacterium]
MTRFGIGQALKRREDQRLITGTGQYIDDVSLPNELHMAFVRSPHPHARIVSIGTAAAMAVPGVVAVLTGAELTKDGVGAFPLGPGLVGADGKPAGAPPYYPLAVGDVRFVGEAVAAVIARTRLQAEDAAEQVAVEYQVLPAVTTIEGALAKSAPQVWNEAPGNVATQMQWGKPDECAAAFAKAKHITKLSLYNQRLVPVTMEPRGSVAEFDAASGRITLQTSCQNPAGLQQTLAEAILKVPMDRVRVRVPDVGGGFGMKTMLYPEDAVCAYAARKVGKPVHWRASRSEEFLAASHGRDQTNEAQLAFDADGKILGLKIDIVGNIGAYGSSPGAIIVVAIGPKVITGVYHVPTLDLRARAVLTHTNLVSAYRGAGRPEAIFLIERLMDQAAAEMQIDPAELRRRNLIPASAMPYTTPMGETFDSGNFANILQRILTHADWNGYAQRREESRKRGRLRGRALSSFLEWTGVVHEEAITLDVEADGRVVVRTAMQAMGQGIETSYVQIIAETLGIDPEHIVIMQGDSDIAKGLGSMGSRSLYIGGSAMLTASNDAIDKGRQLAADALEAAGPDIVYKEGRFTVAGTDVGIGLFDLAGRQPEKRIAISTLQKVGGPSWPNSCHVCEVEVDPETGTTDVVRYTTVDDVGRVVNPMIVAGQVHGGITQAVGQALLEDTRYDPDSGQLVTGSFLDYCMPRADNVPSFSTFTDESSPCKINPLGAKGVGELGTVGGTPTVINALLDALRPLGVKHIEMPATPERVWRAIRTAQGGKN